ALPRLVFPDAVSSQIHRSPILIDPALSRNRSKQKGPPMSLSDETNLRNDPRFQMAAADATRRATEKARMRTTGEERWYLTRMGSQCGINKKDCDHNEPETDDLFDAYGVEYYQPKLRKMVNRPARELTLRQRRSGLVFRRPKLVPLLGPYLP